MLWQSKIEYRDVVGHFRRKFKMMQILLECDGCEENTKITFFF